MKSLHDSIIDYFISESLDKIDQEIIYEKLNAQVLRDVVKQLKNIRAEDQAKINKEMEIEGNHFWGNSKSKMQLFKNIFGSGYYSRTIEWDKITDDDITVVNADEWNDPKKAKKLEQEIRQIIQSKQDKLIFSKNGNKFEYVLFPGGDTLYLFIKNDGYSYYNRKTPGDSTMVRRSVRSSVDLKQADKIALFVGKDLYIIDNITTRKNEYRDKLSDRFNSKQGMILFDEQSLKQIARDNLERYKKIIAQNKAAEENNQNDALMKKAGAVIEKIAHLASLVARDPIINADMVEPINVLCQYVYQERTYVPSTRYNKSGYYTGKEGLLPNLMKYSKAVLSTKSSGHSYDKSNMEAAKTAIEKTLKDIEKYAQDKNIDL